MLENSTAHWNGLKGLRRSPHRLADQRKRVSLASRPVARKCKFWLELPFRYLKIQKALGSQVMLVSRLRLAGTPVYIKGPSFLYKSYWAKRT